MISMDKVQISEDEIAAITEVLRSGDIAQGKWVTRFEHSFAEYIGVKHAIAVNSGTAALHLALLANGIGSGDEVITSAFSHVSTANAILFCGAKPVFADINLETLNMDLSLGIQNISHNTKAIIPVHLFGLPCDMDWIRRASDELGLKIIEDACQAHGAEILGKRAGSFGTGCFSFYATKNMTTGEGGIITTNDDEIATQIRLKRRHGMSSNYLHTVLGYNYKMTEIAGILGFYQLSNLDFDNSLRLQRAMWYYQCLGGIRGLILPSFQNGRVFHRFTIRVSDQFPLSRNDLQDKLARQGIETKVYYPTPIHKQPFYENLGYSVSLPNTELAAGQVLSLPCHPFLTKEDIDKVVRAIWDLIG